MVVIVLLRRMRRSENVLGFVAVSLRNEHKLCRARFESAT